ncbi:restriction endonuclease [Aquimarina sediminis]|uniref:restriction endonuclease n=1 Tax=Aquimarina sediminis TaxID=2070536 RepID=UPI000CA037CF|nr:restriction endonuclease [Aquimarina sediminis]
MKWQEYQEAVGQLYEQMAEFGVVKKNITIPDRVTGQARQIDVWWEMKIENHSFKILIDAKKRKEKIDVKDVEEIMMLAQSVNADKAIIVTNNEWTEPAEKRAKFDGMDLRILSIDEATDLVVEDKWLMCSICNEDCVLLDQSGFMTKNNLLNWWLGGKCRSCDSIYINCQDCGSKGIAREKIEYICECPIKWTSQNGVLSISEFDPNKQIDFEDPNQIKIDFNE